MASLADLRLRVAEEIGRSAPTRVFDYGNTAIEKRALFYKRLLPLLDFGREREGVDLSKVVLTHHRLKDQGKRNLSNGVRRALWVQTI